MTLSGKKTKAGIQGLMTKTKPKQKIKEKEAAAATEKRGDKTTAKLTRNKSISTLRTTHIHTILQKNGQP